MQNYEQPSSLSGMLKGRHYLPYLKIDSFLSSLEHKVITTIFRRHILPELYRIRLKREEYRHQLGDYRNYKLDLWSDSQFIHWHFSKCALSIEKMMQRMQNRFYDEYENKVERSYRKLHGKRILAGKLDYVVKNTYEPCLVLIPFALTEPLLVKCFTKGTTTEYEGFLLKARDLILINRARYDFEFEDNPLVLAF